MGAEKDDRQLKTDSGKVLHNTVHIRILSMIRLKHDTFTYTYRMCQRENCSPSKLEVIVFYVKESDFK